MLPKINCLKKRKDFDSVFKKGKGFREKSLFLKIAKNNLAASRFGFVVGKTLSSKASQRNKIKRRLREIISNKLSKVKPGVDAVIVAQKGMRNEGFQETNETVDRVLKKAKILC
jgi:ribonuclease P protein component